MTSAIKAPNKPDAPNSARAPRFHVERQWRRVGDPSRSVKARVRDRMMGDRIIIADLWCAPGRGMILSQHGSVQGRGRLPIQRSTEQAGAANRSQPVGPETNGTSAAAGFGG
jgi:hypothetical protein